MKGLYVIRYKNSIEYLHDASLVNIFGGKQSE